MRPLILSCTLLLVLSGCGEKSVEQSTQTHSAAPASAASVAPLEPQMISSATVEIIPVSESEPKVLSASELYQKCATCHGLNAEKSALGKSQVIAGWEAQKTVDAIIGYQNGTYGGAMKALMSAQVKTLTQEEIQALARYIAAL